MPSIVETLIPYCAVLLAACAPGRIGGSETGPDASTSASSTDSSSVSSTDSNSGSSDASSSDESSTDTGDDPSDPCPADPELGSYQILLDGNDYAIDYVQLDDKLEWVHSCEVTSHVGTLAGGETIELDCVDDQGQAVQHRLELLAELDGAPLELPVVVGQQVELALWLRVWFSGTVAWTLRDANADLLMLYYNGPYLPDPQAIAGEFAPPLEHIAPLGVAVDMDVCPLVCPEDDPTTTGNFVPGPGCCEKETALMLDLGSGGALVQHQSGGPIPGPEGGHAIVASSYFIDIGSCDIADVSGEFYRFSLMLGQ